MKPAKLFIFLLLFPAVFYGQKTLTGLWTGILTNDSTAIRKDQSIEIALSQYKQKVTGYSRVTFIINDTLYNIVKRVKGTIDGNVCEVIDDEIIAHNFPVKPEKKVKVIYTFLFNPQDSTWRMDGKWRTTKTKQFYSISGNTELKEEKNLAKSKLFPHLEELSLADDVDFYKEAKQKASESIVQQKNISSAATNEKPKPELIAANKPPKKEIIKSDPVIAANTVTETKPSVTNPDEEKKKPEPQKTQPVVTAVQEEKKPKTVKSEPIVISKPEPAKQNRETVTNTATKKENTEPPKPQPVVVAKPQEKKPEPIKQEPVATAKPEEKKPVVMNNTDQKTVNEEKIIAKSPEQKQPQVVEASKPKATIVQPVAEKNIQPPVIAAVAVNERKTISSEIVTFKSDSLQLALYDNGEIDGDTVSVLLNGQIILAKQGLKASAIRKTIYIDQGTEELTLVLYAENLGKYPPNTGLLMVYDGDDRYQVRFSADLQQNAAVILRRKK